jgi:hypothetical protein
LTKRTQEEIHNICNDYKSGLSIHKIIKKYKINNIIVSKLLASQNIIKRTISEVNRIHSVDEHILDNIDTPLKRWLLGWILSDGCVYKNKNQYRLAWDIHQKDKEVLHHIDRMFHTDGKDHVRIFTQKDKKRNKEYLKAELRICGSILGKRLEELNIHPRKSLTSEYLKIISDLPAAEQYSHIHGIYEGDGGLYWRVRQGKTKKTYDIKIAICGTMNICNNINHTIEKCLNISGSILKDGRKETDTWRLWINGNVKARKFLDWIYQDVNNKISNCFLKRKYERYLDFCRYVDEGIIPEKINYSDLKESNIDEAILEAAE